MNADADVDVVVELGQSASYMAGLRDVLVHDYFAIDLEILWQVSTVEVPQVLDALQDVIAALALDSR